MLWFEGGGECVAESSAVVLDRDEVGMVDEDRLSPWVADQVAN